MSKKAWIITGVILALIGLVAPVGLIPAIMGVGFFVLGIRVLKVCSTPVLVVDWSWKSFFTGKLFNPEWVDALKKCIQDWALSITLAFVGGVTSGVGGGAGGLLAGPFISASVDWGKGGNNGSKN